MSRVLQLLDRLTAENVITGYTMEPEPGYLRGDQPVLTYGMYAFDRLGRPNLTRFVRDMTRLGADLSFHHTIGSTAGKGGCLRRTVQLTAVAWFDGRRPLSAAVTLVNRRYVAERADAMPGSWRFPDVRICGVQAPLRDTIPAVAYEMAVRGASVVVLSRAGLPPLAGMRGQPVRLLDPWERYLEMAG